MSERGAGSGGGDDGGLLDALARGSDTAFELAYERFGAALLRAAVQVSGSHAVAEDAVQEVFVGLVRLAAQGRGERVREIRNLRAYLFTAVIRDARRRSWGPGAGLNQGLGRGGAANVRLDVDLPASALESAAPESERDAPPGSERLERALHALPQEQREVVALHIDGGLTFEAIAEALGISVNTASSRYRYALEKLRTAMGATPPGISREAASHG